MRARWLHKWIGIWVGIVLLMWTVTGIILMVPGPRTEVRVRPIPLSRAVVSPSQALARAGGDSTGEVRSTSLIRIHQHVAYRIDRGRRPLLVDAETGERLEITAALAEAIARDATGRSGGPAEVVTVRKHDALYITGNLPVWRVTFEGVEAPLHVSQLDGALVPARSRFRAVVHDLHNMSIVQDLVAGDRFFRAFAIIAGTVALAGILTGYWLALPLRKPTRRARSTEPMSVR
jgi:uncharacterized iron-regulated membrane protein